MQGAEGDWSVPQVGAERESVEQDDGGQCEPDPCRNSARETGPHLPDGNSDLAGRRSGQELAKGNKVGIGSLAEPLPTDHERVSEIAQMRNRPAEAGEPEAKE